jgi:glyoxylate carboligase
MLEESHTVSQPAASTGAQLVLDVLADEGVEIVFGYPGGANMPLYDALYGNPIEHVLTRHEAAAAFAAAPVRAAGSAFASRPRGPAQRTSSPAYSTRRWTRYRSSPSPAKYELP